MGSFAASGYMPDDDEQKRLLEQQSDAAPPAPAAPATSQPGPLDQLYSEYPGLRQYDIQVRDSSAGGKDWKGQPYDGRQMEFYPPDEADNPNPGKPTIETFSGPLKTKDALGEVFSHYLPKKDPQFGAARNQFIQSIDESQRKMLSGDYQQDVRSGVYGAKPPAFDEWMNNQGGDAFFRGYVADQYPKEFYRPDQVEMFNPLLARLKNAGPTTQQPAVEAPPDVPPHPLAALAQANRTPDALDQLSAQPQQINGAPLYQMSQATAPQIPEAPKVEGPNGWALGGAALLDLMLNRGRHTGEILGAIAQGPGAADDKNFHNQLERARTQAQVDHLYAQKAGGARANDPIRAESLAFQKDRFAAEQASRAAALKHQQDLDDPNSEASRADVEKAQRLLPKMADQFVGLSSNDLRKNPALRSAIQIGQTAGKGEEWDRQEAVRQADKLKSSDHNSALTEGRAQKTDLRKIAGEGRAEGRKQAPIDDFIDSIASNPEMRAHFTDGGKAMRARLEINPRGANAAVDDLKSNNRALDALDRLSAIEQEWKTLGTIKYAPKTGVASIALQNSEDYQKAAALEQEYHDLMTEVEGVKARIAQSAGSAAERDEAKSAMPGLGNFTASGRLAGTRNMLKTNTGANLSVLGMAPNEAGDVNQRGLPSHQANPRRASANTSGAESRASKPPKSGNPVDEFF